MAAWLVPVRAASSWDPGPRSLTRKSVFSHQVIHPHSEEGAMQLPLPSVQGTILQLSGGDTTRELNA